MGYTITYRMSLEYYTCTGNILPIGLAVCCFCRDKHLKSVDLSNSKIIPIASPTPQTPPPEPMVPDSNNSNILISSTANPKNPSQNPSSQHNPHQNPPLNFSTKVRQLSTASAISNCSSVSSTNGEVQILLTPVNQQNSYGMSPSDNMGRAVKTVVPVSSSSSIPTNGGRGGVNNFKISRLNDALQAINPRYQPIGFSITSMESCSPSVLQDAISAAETGVFTLLSVIAPGQESQIWETIRPCLDRKLTRSK